VGIQERQQRIGVEDDEHVCCRQRSCHSAASGVKSWT
jgi:hypothetical protein